MPRPILIASNRGPVSFDLDDGELVSSRGAGGLVSALGPLVRGTDTAWVATALSAGDREAARSGMIEAEGFNIRALAIDAEDLDLAYNTIANETLWYLYHDLYDRSRSPVIDSDWYDAWSAYRRFNQVFSQTIIDEALRDSIVLLQDHHLALAAPMIRDERPDISIVHFSHTPFAPPGALRVLPELARTELLLGYLAADSLGFHSSRWSDDFITCCRENLGVRPTNTFVSPLGPDAEELGRIAASPECEAKHAELQALVGDRFVIARTERLELSKNLLRGFWAYDEFLAMRPDLHGDVVFVAALSPSRTGVADYISYRREVESAIDEINARWGRDDWTPIHYRAENDYAFAIAALRRYDALLVNPIRDGLNLVVKEGPIVNEREGVVLLTREAGAFDELSGLVSEVHAYDITQTAQALSTAVDMSAEQRSDLASDLVEVARSRNPQIWLDEQIAAATPDVESDSSAD
ncbi:MAG: trehalose-6-phosphate synthase [Acidimicrobiia bacterium]|nr:trehalose-6-phosphate synthase [Acidimicrobiia bacterium]